MTTRNEVFGLLCTGKGDYSSNSVFLPAAGYCYSGVNQSGIYGYYWSSTPGSGNFAYYMDFSSEFKLVRDFNWRDKCYSVRAVFAE